MSDKSTAEAASGNKPVARGRVGRVSYSVWKNGDFYSTSFERRYKDKDGNWQTATSYGPNELLQLAKAADKAHDDTLRIMGDKAEAA